MWALKENMRCEIESPATDAEIKLLGLGVERWRDGVGRVQNVTDVQVQDLEGNLYGVPQLKSDGSYYNVSREDPSSLKHAVVWDMFERSFESADNVTIDPVTDDNKYAPFVQIDAAQNKFIAQVGADGFIRGLPEGVVQNGQEKDRWKLLRDFVNSTFTGAEMILCGRHIKCTVFAPVLKLNINVLNVDNNACLKCPLYLKSIIVGRKLDFTIFCPPKSPHSPKRINPASESEFHIVDEERGGMQIVLERDDLFDIASTEETPFDFESTIRFFDRWIAETKKSDSLKWETLCVEAAHTDTVRIQYDPRSGPYMGEKMLNPLWCPICKTAQMLPYQFRYREEIQKGEIKNWPTIKQVHPNPLKIILQEDGFDIKKIPDLPLFEPFEYVDGTRILHYCPTYCCATLIRAQAMYEELDTQKVRRPDHCPPFYYHQLDNQICWGVDATIPMYEGYDANDHKISVTEELICHLDLSDIAVFVDDPFTLNANTGKKYVDEFFLNQGYPCPEDQLPPLLISTSFAVIGLTTCRALYGPQAGGKKTGSPWEGVVDVTNEKKIEELMAGVKGNEPTDSVFDDHTVFRDVWSVRLPRERNVEEYANILRCTQECPLGCGEKLPLLDDSKLQLHVQWRCPVAIASNDTHDMFSSTESSSDSDETD